MTITSYFNSTPSFDLLERALVAQGVMEPATMARVLAICELLATRDCNGLRPVSAAQGAIFLAVNANASAVRAMDLGKTMVRYFRDQMDQPDPHTGLLDSDHYPAELKLQVVGGVLKEKHAFEEVLVGLGMASEALQAGRSVLRSMEIAGGAIGLFRKSWPQVIALDHAGSGRVH